jgi:hypothetical protein
VTSAQLYCLDGNATGPGRLFPLGWPRNDYSGNSANSGPCGGPGIASDFEPFASSAAFLCLSKRFLELLGLLPLPFPLFKLPSGWSDLALDAPPSLAGPHAQDSRSIGKPDANGSIRHWPDIVVFLHGIRIHF